MFSHDMITHNKQEISHMLAKILEHKAYKEGTNYCDATQHKEDKLLSRSYITSILQGFDSSKEKFLDYFCRAYKSYLFYKSDDSTHSVYRCDQNSEFFMYVGHKDGRMVLFSCDCQ